MKSLFFALTLVIVIAFGSSAQNVTVLKSDISYKIKDNFSMEYISESTYRIHNEKGYRKAVFGDFYDKNKKIKSITYTLSDVSGNKIKKVKKIDMLDISPSGENELDYTRIIYFDPEYKVFPFDVEISVESVYDGFLALPIWMPRDNFNMNVVNASLSITISTNFPEPRILVTIDSLIRKNKISEGGYTTYTWIVKDLPAVSEDRSYKTFSENEPSVMISPVEFSYDGYKGNAATWVDFGNWYYSLNESRGGLNESTKKFLDGIPNENSEKIVRDIYRYMQNKTRYISIQLGIGGFQSMTSIEVDDLGYGDCKALTNYMHEMLEYKGISSNHVLVRAGEDVPEIIPELPGTQFNHVFLGVPLPNDTLYLECTSQTSPSNYLGTFTDDRNVLWVEKDKSVLFRSPLYDENNNILKTTSVVEIEENGSAKAKYSIIKQGVFYDVIQYLNAINNERQKQYYYGQFPFKDFTILSFHHEQENNDFPSFTSNVDLNITKIANQVDSKWIISGTTARPVDDFIDLSKYKKFAEIKRAFTLEDVTEFKLPFNNSAVYLPENSEITNEFGTYSMVYERTELGFKLTRKIIMKKGRYDASENFNRFYQFVRSINKADKTAIKIENRT